MKEDETHKTQVLKIKGEAQTLKRVKMAVKLSKVACHLLLHSDQPSTFPRPWGITGNMHRAHSCCN